MLTRSLAELFIATLELRHGSGMTLRELRALTRLYCRRERAESYWVVIDLVALVMRGGHWALEACVVEAGRAWWRSTCFTTSGAWRCTAFTRALPRAVKLTVDRLAEADFTLTDWWGQGDGRWAPVIRVQVPGGPGFDYLWLSWQQGGNRVVSNWLQRDTRY